MSSSTPVASSSIPATMSQETIDTLVMAAVRAALAAAKINPRLSNPLSISDAPRGDVAVPPHLSRHARRQARAALRNTAGTAAATPATTSATRIASATATPNLPKAALEKVIVHLFVPDKVAGHVVGHAGTGTGWESRFSCQENV